MLRFESTQSAAPRPHSLRSLGTLLCGVILASSAVAACTDVSEMRTPTDSCTTGRVWVAGDLGHEEMHPGSDCLDCHQRQNGPELAIGGTIYPTQAQETDCYGLLGATVRITGADGVVFELPTNDAGNFYLLGSPEQVKKPFKVEVQVPEQTEQGLTYKVTAMATPALTGSCGNCHAQIGGIQGPVYVKP